MGNRLTPGLSTPSIRFFALRADAPVTIDDSEPGLDCAWRRSLNGQPLSASSTPMTVSDLSAADDTHSAGGLIVVDADNGEHRLDLPAAAAAAGADAIDLFLSADDETLRFVFSPITIDAAVHTRAVPGDEMTLTSAQLAGIVAAIEAELVDDATGEAVKQAIIDKLLENLPDIDDLSLAAIAAAVWDRLVANLTTPDSIGALLAGSIDATISSRLAAAGYTAPDNAIIGSINSKLGTPATSVSADLAAVKADTANLLSRITSTLFAGVTSVGAWLGTLFGSSSDPDTLSEINATTGGATFDNTRDSPQALRARGDAAWLTGESSGGGEPAGVSVTIPLHDQSGNPIADARVWITSDADGETLVDGAYRTNASGLVTFTLIDGNTYFLWAQKSGQQAVSGQPFTAVAD